MEDTLSGINVLRIAILEYFWYFWELCGRILDAFLRFFGVLEGSWGAFGRLLAMFGIMGGLLVVIWSVAPFWGTPFWCILRLGKSGKTYVFIK